MLRYLKKGKNILISCCTNGNEKSQTFFYLDFSCHKSYYFRQEMNFSFCILHPVFIVVGFLHHESLKE